MKPIYPYFIWHEQFAVSYKLIIFFQPDGMKSDVIITSKKVDTLHDGRVTNQFSQIFYSSNFFGSYYTIDAVVVTRR